jgi:hypothetical protein
MTEGNPWAWWEAALATPKLIGIAPSLQIHDGDPQQGFYKTRWKGKNWEPVAIWREEDTWFALRNGRGVDANEIWTWVCRFPITSEAYDRAVAGGGWADDDPSVAAALAKPGHNLGDEFETLKDEIDSAEAGADLYKGIDSDERVGRAQSLRARLNELAGKADKLREAAKKPHLEAGKKVDAQWMPLVKSAKAIADTIRWEIEKYQTLKLQEQRKLEALRQRELDRIAREEEVLKAKIAEAEAAGLTPVVPPTPAPLPEIVPVFVPDKIKGNYGRAATLGTEIVVTGITDQDALYQSLRDHPDLRACLLDLAKRALKAGRIVPGITTEERAKIS